MTENLPSMFPRMYEIIETFVTKFTATPQKLRLKEEASQTKIESPDGEVASIAMVLGHLVSEYVRRSDAMKALEKWYEDHPDGDAALLEVCRSKCQTTANSLLQYIGYAYALNLVDEESQKELDELRKNKAELEKRVVQLSRDLKKCRDESEGYKRTVKPLDNKKNPEYGDVVAP
jgi:chromosome segregation ATPase